MSGYTEQWVKVLRAVSAQQRDYLVEAIRKNESERKCPAPSATEVASNGTVQG